MHAAELQLPADLVASLSSGMQLRYPVTECECGQVVLLTLDELVGDELVIMPDYGTMSAKEIEAESGHDPHEEDGGYYATIGVNLILDAEEYPPDFLLTWLPELKCYGGFNIDTDQLFVFPGATWTDIAAAPLDYLNASWRDVSDRITVVKVLPWRHGVRWVSDDE
jgi:hypothetical protein